MSFGEEEEEGSSIGEELDGSGALTPVGASSSGVSTHMNASSAMEEEGSSERCSSSQSQTPAAPLPTLLFGANTKTHRRIMHGARDMVQGGHGHTHNTALNERRMSVTKEACRHISRRTVTLREELAGRSRLEGLMRTIMADLGAGEDPVDPIGTASLPSYSLRTGGTTPLGASMRGGGLRFACLRSGEPTSSMFSSRSSLELRAALARFLLTEDDMRRSAAWQSRRLCELLAHRQAVVSDTLRVRYPGSSRMGLDFVASAQCTKSMHSGGKRFDFIELIRDAHDTKRAIGQLRAVIAMRPCLCGESATVEEKQECERAQNQHTEHAVLLRVLRPAPGATRDSGYFVLLLFLIVVFV